MKYVSVCLLLFITIFVLKYNDEHFTTGFGVTSGLTYYNKARRCQHDDMYGSRSPYCETIGTVVL